MADSELLEDNRVILCNVAALCHAADAKKIADHAVVFFDCNLFRSHCLVAPRSWPIKLGTVVEFAVV
jgi:hypothetical protein